MLRNLFSKSCSMRLSAVSLIILGETERSLYRSQISCDGASYVGEFVLFFCSSVVRAQYF